MNRIKNLEFLLNKDNENDIIMEVDQFISELCHVGHEIYKLNEAQKVFFLNQNFEREINNGGFNQFFGNSSGDFALDTVLSLKEIRAFHTSDLLQQAINQFPNIADINDRDIRNELMEEIEETANEIWNELDNQFYEYQDDLNELNLEFIKNNKNAF